MFVSEASRFGSKAGERSRSRTWTGTRNTEEMPWRSVAAMNSAGSHLRKMTEVEPRRIAAWYQIIRPTAWNMGTTTPTTSGSVIRCSRAVLAAET